MIKKYMIKNIIIKIILVFFRNWFENLYVFMILKEIYFLIVIDMELIFLLKISICNFKIER